MTERAGYHCSSACNSKVQAPEANQRTSWRLPTCTASFLNSAGEPSEPQARQTPGRWPTSTFLCFAQPLSKFSKTFTTAIAASSCSCLQYLSRNTSSAFEAAHPVSRRCAHQQRLPPARIFKFQESCFTLRATPAGQLFQSSGRSGTEEQRAACCTKAFQNSSVVAEPQPCVCKLLEASMVRSHSRLRIMYWSQ